MSKSHMIWIEDSKTPETVFSPMSPDRSADDVAIGRYKNSPYTPQVATNLDDNYDDAVLAHAIAESKYSGDADLPTGVSLRDQQEDIMLRILANQIFPERYNNDAEISPSLERRLRDFRFAQAMRREKFGNDKPWGIIGLYDHLANIRIDVEWAEDAAHRRENSEPYLSWADFEEHRNKGYNRPFFVYSILFICTICLLASIGLNGWTIEPVNINPMIGPSAKTLTNMGAKQSSLIVNYNEWYRLVTPMVLHAGIIHYFLNMCALWFIGGAVEKSHGSLSTAVIFFVPAIGGTILSALFLPEYISVGASGGIFGLIGACIADVVTHWTLLFSKQVNSSDDNLRGRHTKVLLWLIFDITINSVIGLTPFIDNFTHLGGMLYGFLCGLCTMERVSTMFFGVKNDLYSRTKVTITRFGGIILTIVLIFISLGLLAESDGIKSPCTGCRYVSCVPFPFGPADEKKWWYCDDCDTVQADALQDKATKVYTALRMTCPDGALEDIDLRSEAITETNVVRDFLPTLCRRHCDRVFAN